MQGKGSRWVLWGIVAGIVAGGVVGTFAPKTGVAVGWFGDLFLQMLKLIVVPLVVTSMISGIGGLGDIRHTGRTGRRTILFYACTTFLSVIVGLVLVNIVRPGAGFDKSGIENNEEIQVRTLDKLGWKDRPELVTAVEGGEMTRGEAIEKLIAEREKTPGEALIGILETMFPPNIVKALSETNVLAIIVFALIFGGILTTLGEAGRRLLDDFDSANQAIMKMVNLLMFLAPPGIFALVAARLGNEGGGDAVFRLVKLLGAYAATVLGGLLIHALIVLPIILKLLTGRSPLSYAVGVGKALLTAFSTASSSATLPVTIDATTRNNGVSERSSNFVLPLGATVNMDGTALYEAVAVMFIAQSYGLDMGIAQQVVIFLTATLASVGAAGIPEAGLVTMVMVLAAVNIPIGGMALILVIDWFLDRCRTTVNVWGDSVGAAVVDRLEEKDAAGD